MENTAGVHLEFRSSPKGCTLEHIHFCPGQNLAPVESFRGDRFARVGRSFTWSRGLRAVALLLVRHFQASNSDRDPAIEGARESPAQTLYHLLDHPERSSAALPFTDAGGTCHLKRFLECANLGKRGNGHNCYRLWINVEHLSPVQIRLSLDDQLLPPHHPRAQELADDLALAWPDWRENKASTADKGLLSTPARTWRAELGHFPMAHGPFIGQKDQLQAITHALNSAGKAQIIGSGGAGKSTLVCHWLEHLQNQNSIPYGGLFAWSFAEQSRAGDHTMAADDCLRALLLFCGQSLHEEGSAYQRGLAAARAAAEQRLLVVLDGVETLQIPSGPEQGLPHDPGLRGFLHPGIHPAPHSGLHCIMVSRLEMPTPLGGHVIRLGRLPPEDAIALLQAHGVTGPEPDMQRLVELGHGHPLTLQLMGHYLRHAHQGQARSLAEDGKLLTTDTPLASHAHRMMSDYEASMADSARARLLYLLSLFDHPVTMDELADLLFHGPQLPAFRRFFPTSATLRAIANELAAEDLLILDTRLNCHPLVIHHFAGGFQQRFPEDYRSAHTWLYQRICQDPAIPTHPTTREQYEALLAAFHHGREAGKLAECWQEIAWHRIMRDGKSYHMTGDLAEFHLCLRTWAAFWKTPWEELHPDLPAAAHPIVQGSAGFCLFMIERVEESERVLHRALGNSLRSARPHHLLQPAAVLGLIRMHQGRYQEARRILAPIAQIARWTGPFTAAPDHVLLAPLCHLAFCHHKLGNTRNAQRLFQRAIRHHRSTSDWDLPPLLVVSYWRFLLESGDLEGYQRSAEYSGHATRAATMPLLHQTGMINNLRANAALLQWQLSRQESHLCAAQSHNRSACLQSEENGFRMFHCYNLHQTQTILQAQGHHDQAAQLQAEITALATQFGLQQFG